MRFSFLHTGVVFRDGQGVYSSNQSIVSLYASFAEYFGELELIAPVRENGRGVFQIHDGITVHPIPDWKTGWELYSPRLFWIIPDIVRLFRQHRGRWDAIWLIDLDPLSEIAWWLAGLCGIFRVLYLRGDAQFEIPFRHDGLSRLPAKLWTLYLSVIAPAIVSRTLTFVTGQQLLARYQGYSKQIHPFIASTVRHQDIAASIRKTCLPNQQLKLIYTGRLIPLKGLELLVQTIADLTQLGYAIDLTIAGEGPSYENLQRLVDALDLAKHVVFAGFVKPGPELRALYQIQDAFVLPSLSEGTPKSVMEALAQGLPIIATTVGGVPQLVGDAGLFFSPGDKTGLQKALQQIADDSRCRELLAEKALVRAKELTIDVQLRQVEELIAVYSQGRRPTS
jgi:glycosyltransferase involved in cell wall biosynthesis